VLAVADALGTSEEGARKRVARALEKLRCHLSRRGVRLSSAALGAGLAAAAVQTAPAGLAMAVTAASLTATTTAGTALSLSLLKVMSMTKLNIGLVSALVVAGVATPLALQQHSINRLRAENFNLLAKSRGVDQFRAENAQGVKQSADPSELDRLRTELADLHKLRAEVARLRGENKDVNRIAAENVKLRHTLAQRAGTQDETQDISPEQEEYKRQGINRMNFSKQWVISFLIYADKHEGRFPQSFSDIQDFDATAGAFEGLSASDFEITYNGKLTDLKEPNRVIVLREKEARTNPDGKWNRTYGFADGHSEIHSAEDGNFEPWEQQHLATSTPQ